MTTSHEPRFVTSHHVSRHLAVGLATLLAGATIMAGWPAGASAAVFKVGVGGAAAGCTHSTLAGAIGASIVSGEADEIWLTKNSMSYTNVALDFGSFTDGITFLGGYDTCSSTVTGSRTLIDGSPGQPIFDIFDSSVIEMRRLDLSGTAGTAVEVGNGAQVIIRDSLLHGNGRGASVDGGASLEIEASAVYDNTIGPISEGGGVRCEGVGTELILNNSQLFDNQAVDGGGLWAGFFCDAELRTYSVIAHNIAEQGGGVYLTDFASVTSNPGIFLVSVDNNRAEGFGSNSGGGVYAENGSTFDVVNAKIVDNVAEFGGGLYSEGGSLVRIQKGPGACLADPCVQLSRNLLSPSGGSVGAAGYAINDGDIVVYQADVVQNADDDGDGYPFIAFGSSSSIILEGVKLWDNRGTALVLADVNGFARMTYVTSAGNSTSGGADARIAELHNGATMELNSSIFWDSAGFTRLTGGTITEADCLISNNFANVQASSSLSTANPQFLNAATGDLRVRPASPAIDYCDDALVSSFASGDIEGEPRGDDHPQVPNTSGLVFDLGYDESYMIFAGNFEPGDLSEWSSSTP